MRDQTLLWNGRSVEQLTRAELLEALHQSCRIGFDIRDRAITETRAGPPREHLCISIIVILGRVLWFIVVAFIWIMIFGLWGPGSLLILAILTGVCLGARRATVQIERACRVSRGNQRVTIAK